MNKDIRWGFDACGHAHCWPPDAVESDDLFTNEVMDVGPPGRYVLWVFAIAEGREVVNKRVVPDVKHMSIVPRNRDSPTQTCPSNRYIFEPTFNKTQGFISL